MQKTMDCPISFILRQEQAKQIYDDRTGVASGGMKKWTRKWH